MKPSRIITCIALLFLVAIGYISYKYYQRKKTEADNDNAATAAAKQNRHIKIIKA